MMRFSTRCFLFPFFATNVLSKKPAVSDLFGLGWLPKTDSWNERSDASPKEFGSTPRRPRPQSKCPALAPSRKRAAQNRRGGSSRRSPPGFFQRSVPLFDRFFFGWEGSGPY